MKQTVVYFAEGAKPNIGGEALSSEADTSIPNRESTFYSYVFTFA